MIEKKSWNKKIIKHRGETIDTNEIIFGYYYKDIVRDGLNPDRPILFEKDFIRLIEPKGIFLALEVKPDSVCEFTNYYDCDHEEIYENDLLENDEFIFQVIWNKNQSAWWLELIKVKKSEVNSNDDFMIILENQSLGNGYLSRDDLKLVKE